MKKLSFLALAAAGLMMVGCADKDEVVKEVVNPAEFTDGAYIGISLQLPSADEGLTRANDELSNGTADEFEVKNATLYIFKLAKTSTANPDVAATYVDKVSLGNTYDSDKQGGLSADEWGVQSGVDETNITSTYNKATLIPNALASQMKTDTENNYYAYVIVNHNGQVNVTEGMTFANFSSQEFTEIGADIAAEKNIWESGLLMTNAPICNYGGGSAAPVKGTNDGDPDVAYTTLVPLDNNKIFGGKAEAEANPAGCVYIERAAVKITVEDGRGTNTKIGEYEVTLLGWQVINNERSYYNTRQIEEAWGAYTSNLKAAANNKYRFVSKYQFLPTLPGTTGHTTGYRTYFAKDMHYNTDAVAAAEGTPSTLDNTVASESRPWITVGAQKHAYTTENTFDVAHQTWRNTTMVTLKVQIGDGTTGFYTVGKDGQTMYTKDDAAVAIENVVKGDNDVAAALTALRVKISENHPNTTVKSGLKVTIGTSTTGKTDLDFTIDAAYTKDNVAYTSFNTTADADGKSEKDLYDELMAAINAVVKTTTGTGTSAVTTTSDNVLLSYYAGGISYYNARIQHFGEAETPWSADGDYVTGGGKDVKEIYGYDITKAATDGNNVIATERFLGRYGVVRDNWYKLSIDKIGKIGSAEPVDPSTTTPDTPDDEIENFISVHVHIVPWVLRQQSVQF